MLKIGLIGVGQFGKVLKSKLEKLHYCSLIWTCDSKDNWQHQVSVDWVVIASPNVFHFEQTSWFLKNGVNVFCEKPATLSLKSLLDLYEIAKRHNVLLYVDDVYSYHNYEKSFKFFYSKPSRANGSNPIDRIAYHHFYLCCPPDPFADVTVISKDIKSHNNISFSLNIAGEKYSYSYDLESQHSKCHSLKSNLDVDPLLKMFDFVFSEKCDFILNRKHTIFATRVSELVKKEIYPTIAVVGAGIYGTTSAIHLAQAGFNTHILESKDQPFSCASGINQYRIHRGYHYPRCSHTINSCNQNSAYFSKYFQNALISSTQQVYAISDHDSVTSDKEYLNILNRHKLEYKILPNLPHTKLTVEVNENLYDPFILSDLLSMRMYASNVTTHYGVNVTSGDCLKDYKYKLFATYKTLNNFLPTKQVYQFELCEKPIFKLPPKYINKGIVIMDGPFMCFDPFAATSYHVAGNVTHAIHHSNIGYYPETPNQYVELLDNGVVNKPSVSKYKFFIDSAKPFFPDIAKAEYIGSMFTHRVVLPHVDSTDSRPTLLTFGDDCAYIFSGKVVNALQSAQQVSKYFVNLFDNSQEFVK